jgi:hypothetical protein
MSVIYLPIGVGILKSLSYLRALEMEVAWPRRSWVRRLERGFQSLFPGKNSPLLKRGYFYRFNKRLDIFSKNKKLRFPFGVRLGVSREG